MMPSPAPEHQRALPVSSSSPASAATTATSSTPPLHHDAAHAPALHTAHLQPPPSPRTHRALRRLQSAHALGASRALNQPSLISQQRRDLDRSSSPTSHRDSASRSPHRARANSDASPPPVHPMASAAASGAKRSALKKPVFSHGHLTLQQIIRDGPNDGDYVGALESARWKVVDEGIKSAEDGMVPGPPPTFALVAY